MNLIESLNNNFAKTIQYIHICDTIDQLDKAIEALENPNYEKLPKNDPLVEKQLELLKIIAYHKIEELRIKEQTRDLSKLINNLCV
jgi:hypothetical protein